MLSLYTVVYVLCLAHVVPNPPLLSSLLPLQKLALRRPAVEDSERYYQDLQQQAEERHRSRVREKEEDRRLAQQVLHRTFCSWGQRYMLVLLGIVHAICACVVSVYPCMCRLHWCMHHLISLRLSALSVGDSS